MCCWPGARSTAKSETLLASRQIICIHSSSTKSDKACAFCTHGFHTTVVREFSFLMRVRRRKDLPVRLHPRCSGRRDRFLTRSPSRHAASSSDSSRFCQNSEPTMCLSPVPQRRAVRCTKTGGQALHCVEFERQSRYQAVREDQSIRKWLGGNTYRGSRTINRIQGV